MLAAIPLLGFLANGTAFTTGQAEVENEFNSVKQANTLSETSHDLKNALGSMRILVRDFAWQPSNELIQTFEDVHKRALNSLVRVEGSVNAAARAEIEGLRQRLAAGKQRFDHLVDEQKQLGYSDDEGIRQRMREAATAVERIINEDMGWLTKADAQKLLISLVEMRRHESEYRLTRTSIASTSFQMEFRRSTRRWARSSPRRS